MWYTCKAKQVRDVNLYVEAESLEEAKELLSQGEWLDMEPSEDDEDEGVKDIDLDTIVEAPDFDEDDDEDDDDDDCD